MIGAQINQQLSLVVLTFNINEISRVLECNKRKIIIVFTRAKTRKRGNLAVVKYFWCLVSPFGGVAPGAPQKQYGHDGWHGFAALSSYKLSIFGNFYVVQSKGKTSNGEITSP